MNSVFALIDRIKERPAMYLSRNYISCLKAFIDGWFLRDPSIADYEDPLNDFQKWIEAKYRVTSSHSWCDIILFYSQDESDALTNFFKDFEEWRRESGY